MRKIFTLALLVLFNQVEAQTVERVVSGQLTSQDDGTPLPGVNIVIKGTMLGTVTDADGKYSLSVPIGSILVFSFIGMQTTEVLVTETSLKPLRGARSGGKSVAPVVRAAWPSSILQDSVKNQEGVAVLSQQSPTYKLFTQSFNPKYINSIKRMARLPRRQSVYAIRTNSDDIKRGLHGQYSTTLGIETATRFPGLQNTYAQGRSLNQQIQWQGADSGEAFSWGPAIKTLEYDGVPYEYDALGSLVFSGQGNGQRAKAFDAFRFFKPGFTVANELQLSFPSVASSFIQVDAYRKNRSGIIPSNALLTHGASIKLRGLRLGSQTEFDASFLYNGNQGDLLSRGANLAAIMGSVYLTPTSFDNANKYRTHNTLMYRLPDGRIRSAAPAVIDNPFGLAQEFPDREKMNRVVACAAIHFAKTKPFRVTASWIFDEQAGTMVHGIAPGWSGYQNGRRTQRNETQRNMQAAFVGEYSPPTLQDWKFSGSYNINHEKRRVNRTDGFGFLFTDFNRIENADSLITWDYVLARTIHEVNLKANYETAILDLTIANRNYFSNTYSVKNYVNLFPFISAKLDWNDWLYLWDFDIKTFASYARTLRENPLVQQNLSTLSLATSAQQYSSYFENKEIMFQSGLAPEMEDKIEAGVLADRYQFRFNISGYWNKTTNLIVPVWQQNAPVLQNAADVSNAGVNVLAQYFQYFHPVRLQVGLKFTHYNTMVTDVYRGDWLPLAGFLDVFSVAQKGEALGTIFGSTWLRNENGQQVIGADGFPLVNSQPKKIGSPIPDYLLALDAQVSIKRFNAGFVLEYKQGGDVWNGTHAALDYHGRSIETASQRQIGNYVFDGVTQAGSINAIPVEFYDATKSVTANRWVRYGFSGVAEDYIEDGSWLRLSEINLSYKLFLRNRWREATLSFIGRNLLLLTPYSGVDPATTLFGYATTLGLDMFNTPSTRSFNFQITVKF